MRTVLPRLLLLPIFILLLVQSPISLAALQLVAQEIGRISISVDAEGNNNSAGGTVRVNKPNNAVVRRAFFMANSHGVFDNKIIANGDITLSGIPISWDRSIFNGVTGDPAFFHNVWADVTDIVKPIIDSSPSGILRLIVTETDTTKVNGTVLVVIFDDPNQIQITSIILLFGDQSTGGDTFVIDLSEPLDSQAIQRADMGLGMGHGFQGDFGTPMVNLIDVNGQRLTSSAGGEDDGTSEDGGLITVGGIGDTNANPPPFAPSSGYRTDDELYDLSAFVSAGDRQIEVFSVNPTDDDNIFFAYFVTSVPSVSLPIPVVTPQIDAFPEPGELYSELAQFVEERNGDFSETTGVFLKDRVTKLGNVFNKGLKQLAKAELRVLPGVYKTAGVIASVAALPETGAKAAITGLACIFVPDFLPLEEDDKIRQKRVIETLCLAKEFQEFIPNPTVGGLGTVTVGLATYFFNEVSVPQLTKISEDPPDPEFKKVFVPNIPAMPIIEITGNQELNAVFRRLLEAGMNAFRFLYAMNISYDRYTSAYAAGDTISSTLQIEAILQYLSLYDEAIILVSEKWNEVEQTLRKVGYNDKKYNPLYLKELQDEIKASGVPSEVMSFLDEIGMTPGQIAELIQRILEVEPKSIEGTVLSAMKKVSQALLITSTKSPREPPVANAGTDQTVECTDTDGAVVTLDGSGSSDPDGDALTYSWTGPFGTVSGVQPTVTLPLGMHTISLDVDDGNGGTASDAVEVTVEDTVAPTLEVTLSPAMLWPPNHKTRDIDAVVTASDACDANPVIVLTSVVSNEPDNGKGDGNTVNDIQGADMGTDDRQFKLRAERSGKGNGRVYTATYTAADAAGNQTSASAAVTVPHSK